MNNVIKNLIVKWLLAHLATAVGTIDWASIKASIAAKLETAVPYPMLDKPIELLVDEVLDAAKDAMNDQADIDTLIRHCADANWAAAELDLQAILNKVADPTEAQKDLKLLLAA